MESLLRPVFSKMDESFRTEDTGMCSLLLQVSDKRVTWCIQDVSTNRFVAIESFPSVLEEAARETALFRQPFRSVFMMLENNISTLIPRILFEEKDKETYLDFIHGETDGLEICRDLLDQLDIVNVYGIAHRQLEYAKQLFPSGKIFHHSTAMIKSITMNYKNRINSTRVFIHVREQDFDLLVFDGKKVEYFNSFHFLAPSDLAYYVIFVMEQLNLNPEETGIILMGSINRDSETFELLFRYIRNIEFADRNESFRYSYIFNDIPPHQHYLLLNLGLCGL
ncbi:MAG: DUF3822 family protein [Bacteroidetes bacterium]|nr:DUF3822 family protein [Bacteroidota bacterium]